ncbi:MAG: ribbon-helix-helix domain-containing protein [Candidatus Helarchaeota archaeon]
MKTIPIPLEDRDLEKIDYLIKIGRYKNRTQAIKALLQEKLAQETIIFEWEQAVDESSIKRVIEDLTRSSEFSFTIKSKQSAAELIGEERERY